MNDAEHKKLEQARSDWEEGTVAPKVQKFGLPECPTRHYSPLDHEDTDYLEKVGFPGQYPYTAGNEAVDFWRANSKMAAMAGFRSDWGTAGAGKYGGFGTAEDYRDYLKRMHAMGRTGGPNIAFDLPTQLGYDSDSEYSSSEVGRVGVAIDTFRDFETIYEPYTGVLDIDKVPSNFTINAPAIVIIAMYIALAEKRGVDLGRLRGTPQNDILKEFVGRGLYIFPPGPSLRLWRDTLVFCTKHTPNMNITSIGGYHIREAGATQEQDLAFSMAIGRAYLQAGVSSGLDIDAFAPNFTFNAFGGSMEIYKEIAFQRAARRMWARMLKEEFGAKKHKSMLIRQSITAHIGCSSTTLQRPLNNLSRAVMGGVAAGMSGGMPGVFPPFDEPMGLGHSQEAVQLNLDATRILIYEAKLGEVNDPWAGSYFMEAMTDEIEQAALAELERIDAMGGTIAAIDNGYMVKAIAKSAYERQKRVENQEDYQVGVNCWPTNEKEIAVSINREVEATYDPELMNTCEERQKTSLAKVRDERNNGAVTAALAALKLGAQDESVNLMPAVLECVKHYATLQEICDVFRDVFGEAQPNTI